MTQSQNNARLTDAAAHLDPPHCHTDCAADELSELVKAWPTLPPHIRAAITALVGTGQIRDVAARR